MAQANVNSNYNMYSELDSVTAIIVVICAAVIVCICCIACVCLIGMVIAYRTKSKQLQLQLESIYNYSNKAERIPLHSMNNGVSGGIEMRRISKRPAICSNNIPSSGEKNDNLHVSAVGENPQLKNDNVDKLYVYCCVSTRK